MILGLLAYVRNPTLFDGGNPVCLQFWKGGFAQFLHRDDRRQLFDSRKARLIFRRHAVNLYRGGGTPCSRHGFFNLCGA